MKKLLLVSLVFVAVFFTGIINGWSAVTLPTANFSGDVQTTGPLGDDPGSLTLVNTVISKVNYLDGTSVSVNGPDESIIGMTVTISGAARTGDYSFSDAVISISDGTFNYFTATLSNIIFVTDGYDWYLNPGLDISNPSTLNLTNVILNTDIDHPSKYIDELAIAKGSNAAIGMKMILTIVNGSITGNSSSDILVGLVDGSPPVVEAPSGARSVGFWKNHDDERTAFIGMAVSFSSIFDSDAALTYYLTKKGKKTMEEKAKQQLSAVLLNVASSLDPLTPLSQGEIDILHLLNPTVGSSVEDAIMEIENALLNGVGLEDAKDLAEEINNRDNTNN